MRLPDWVWKMNLTGAAAVVHLTCLGLSILTVWMFGGMEESYADLPKWKIEIFPVAAYFILVLTFPIAWCSILDGYESLPLLASILVPINAYFWGGCLSWLIGPNPWPRRENIDPGDS